MARCIPATHAVSLLLLALLMNPPTPLAQVSIKGVALVRGAPGKAEPQNVASRSAATSVNADLIADSVAIEAAAAAAAKPSRAPLRYSRKEVIGSFNKAAHLLRQAAQSFSQTSMHFSRLFTAMQAFRNAVALVEMGKRKYNLAEPQMLNGIRMAQQELPQLEPAPLAREMGRQLTAPEGQARRYVVRALKVAQNGLISFQVQKSRKRQQELREQQLQRVQKGQQGPVVQKQGGST